MHASKILIIGEPGSGKTTAVAALSDVEIVSTDVAATDELARIKDTTTVAFDYGEIRLGQDERILLYGLPGQGRFAHMVQALAPGTLGVILLLDHAADDPLRGLRETLHHFGALARDRALVVAVNKTARLDPALRTGCMSLLAGHGVSAPLVPVDARRRDSLVPVLELLLDLVEFSGIEPSQDPPLW